MKRKNGYTVTNLNSIEPYTAHSCLYEELKNPRTFFSVTLLSRLSSGDSLPWVVKGVRGVYYGFSRWALEPAVRTRILDSREASSKFWVDQPGSGAP